ncbi:MaoC family dehydratase [Marinitenerispora sediminis]|uniref:Enoyl-CoA hydratase n=1 Tax=Marinitenerispora sediminis TaxID=1931232 RepID=A0A368T8R8_9ACTN|nr:MaoC family dehydratase [Marinitenerispora sediminis]RCV52634.1 enoyl-CoA hydratase [Marinitenerispora sediminis]RCV60328.1 enoyl-CoA hydratase [Marinitenerispora sediminis]RCV60581.1 enoyl-CoA hydratase [Marinitenerispora sediminis]
MRKFADAAALAAARGEHLGHSDWHVITQDRIDAFAEATDDRQWIHVDPRRAADGPFGTTIAHGFLSLSLLPALAAEVYTLEERPRLLVNYGLNRVRFLAPVAVGSRVRDGIELVEAAESAKGVLLTMRHEVEIEDGGRPALVAETLTLAVP